MRREVVEMCTRQEPSSSAADKSDEHEEGMFSGGLQWCILVLLEVSSKRKTLQAHKLINWFGAERMSYRCKKALRCNKEVQHV